MKSVSKISVLSDQTINKIAAGEVIENPSSVVKELVENALDAGATEICIEIQSGGRQLIRISDNGCGMLPDDALLCLERHATSKIREVEDIQDLLTMGFRGEAIPSIAAISKFTLLTCPRQEEQQLEGSLIVVDGGRIVSHAPAARSPGTTIEVKSLFFNVPVRRKFQKSPSYDAQEILKTISAIALGHPLVQFELLSDQKSLFKTPFLPSSYSFQEKLHKRIETLLGKEYANSLCALHFEQTPYNVEGYIGLPSHHKANRTGQYLFINERAVYSPFIASAIREGYGTMLATNRYPVFVLHLRLPGNLIDVNVHPQKKEVRLRQEHLLKTTLLQAVQKSLRQDPSSFSLPLINDEKPFSDLSAPYSSLLPPFFQTKKEHFIAEGEWEYKTNPVGSSNISITPVAASPLETAKIDEDLPWSTPPLQLRLKPSVPPPTPHLFDRSKTKETPHVLMTLLGYIGVDSFSEKPQAYPFFAKKESGGLCLVDQRAAYTRISYERLLKQANNQQTPIQSLLVPLTLSYSYVEAALLREHLENLNKMGFSIREFGDHTFVLDAFPLLLKKEDPEAWLNAIIHDLTDQKELKQLQARKEEQLALAACRSSLPSNKRLSIEEAQGVIDQLFACDMPFQCPFGKPTILYFSPHELANLFIR